MKILTVCIPVLNEGEFIERLVDTIVSAPPEDKEIILIDGGSTDDTLLKIKALQIKYPNLILIKNEHRFVSHGFNKAYRMSDSKYITLMGAHTEYPVNYFVNGISLLGNEDCEAAGGPLNHFGRSFKGRIIARCMSSRFGVGNSEFRTTREKGYVQSVPMAIYKRSVFEKIGLLDEELIRNQDDEFHYRMNANGFKILMDPSLEIKYYVRDNFRALWKQYFGYGLYKPLVFKKVRSQLRIRHLIPAVFVLYLIFLPVMTVFSRVALFPLIKYFFLSLYNSIKISQNIKEVLYAMTSFLILHLAYGTGFIIGLRKIF